VRSDRVTAEIREIVSSAGFFFLDIVHITLLALHSRICRLLGAMAVFNSSGPDYVRISGVKNVSTGSKDR